MIPLQDYTEVKYPNATSLRRSPTYYNGNKYLKTSTSSTYLTPPHQTNSYCFSCPSVYCVGLNTFFASVFPLLSLLYLNIKTLSALKRLIKERTSQGMELASLVSVTANPVSGHVLTVGGHQDIEGNYLSSLDLLNDIFWILVLFS